MLHDDTTAAIRAWIDRRTGELPAGFGRDVRAWLVVLLDGDARTRPRSHATVRFHFGSVRPFIECWAATRGHLREITSGDVDAVLEPLRGHRRYNAITALRSLFRFAKRRGLTFADPTRHLRGGRGAGRTVLPMTAEQIRAVEQAAVTPAQRLAIALAAVHAARPRAIRELTLDDIDLPSRRITIAGHRQPLGELTRNALLAWLEYRRATWPDTANRHVLVSRISALGTGPVSAATSPTTSAGTSAASPSSTSGATASCTKPWPPAPTRSTLPWSSTSTTPTRWPTPTPPATFSPARPNRSYHPIARHEHEGEDHQRGSRSRRRATGSLAVSPRRAGWPAEPAPPGPLPLPSAAVPGRRGRGPAGRAPSAARARTASPARPAAPAECPAPP